MSVPCRCDRPLIVKAEADRCVKCGHQVAPVRGPDSMEEALRHVAEHPPGQRYDIGKA